MAARNLANILESQDRSLRKLVFLLADLSLKIVGEISRSLKSTEKFNIYGERQTEIDVWSNELLTRKLLRTGLVRQIASEEMARPLKARRGEYSIVLDPLDGSSNVTSNNLMGTIVGIYHNQDLPAKGRDLLSSLYFVYGPYVEVVVAFRDGVYVLAAAGTADGPTRFISLKEQHRLPEKGSVYGIGGSRGKWEPRMREFAARLEERNLKLRYGGSFVGDYNQVLHNGGFFAYPELMDAPDGKYRLQFESNPVAFITEKAGGRASTGRVNILDLEPSHIAQRVPTYLGNKELVTEFEELVTKPAL